MDLEPVLDSTGAPAERASSNYQPPPDVHPRLEAARFVLAETGAASPLVMFDRDALTGQVELWRRHMELVEPHFAIKTCNALPVLRHFQTLGISFDAATAGEIRILEQLGVPPERVICTHPVRDVDDLQAIARYRPGALVVENTAELRKLERHGIPARDYAPKIFLRVELPFGGLSGKFGVEIARLDVQAGAKASWHVVTTPARRVFEEARAIERETGFRYESFGLTSHVGTNAVRVDKYRILLRVFAHLRHKLAGHGIEIATFNLGGGYCDSEKPLEAGTTQAAFLEELGGIVRAHAAEQPGVRFIAEPGRFMVSNSGSAVIGVMQVDEREVLLQPDGSLQPIPHLKVQMNDGLYGNLLGEVHDEKSWQFVPFRLGDAARPLSSELLPAILNGKTCDSWDRLARMRALPRNLQEGDHLLVPHAGAYTLVTATDFNSAPRSLVCLYWREAGGLLRCAAFDAQGREVATGRQAGSRESVPQPTPGSALRPRYDPESQVFSLYSVMGSTAAKVPSALLRPGEVLGGVDWQQVLSLVYQNDVALRVQDVTPVADGASAWVLRVRRLEHRDPLALKVGKRPLLGAAAAAFRSVAAELAGLSADPRIPRIVEFGLLPGGGRPWVLEEFVVGRPIDVLLADVLAGRAREAKEADWRDALALTLRPIAEAAMALSGAHARGVVHGDVRAANLVVQGPSRAPVKVLGWPLFRAAAEIEPECPSPERVRGAGPSGADDVWALGATLYRLTSGSHPLEHLGDTESRRAALLAAGSSKRSPVRRPSVAGRKVPAELESIAMKALRIAPEERYRSAALFADDLLAFLGRRVVLAHREALAAPLRLWYGAQRTRRGAE
jgi:ornithine decarboxylase